MLGISQKALRSMPIAFPEFSEQQRIGELLASLDDKIELNRKMSATLEAIARALFRDWFVDFGPTRAKMAGTAPYLSPDLWSLLAGVNLREAPRRIGDHPHCLLRLHGEADTAIGRVLTREEYEANYGVEGSYREILRATINATSLLFLGCSLNVDRTIASLAELKGQARVATPRHYAFLPLTEGMDREARRAELGAADIHPIWYPPENHDQSIEDLLISLIEGGFHE
ncbi:Type I restriction modification DNA specificity domain-containing protein [Loktanella atrilutea]|uniref:Type I restriction modification DNA specificity domain-containing protein n=1 Tax=Loktanella atrilutea TaxID=366533 RepID=A0A1M5AML4_LOKAT|nr:Type I restriction modification DNA specificity domain-containing protein [Loktanella atrilutea]